MSFLSVFKKKASTDNDNTVEIAENNITYKKGDIQKIASHIPDVRIEPEKVNTVNYYIPTSNIDIAKKLKGCEGITLYYTVCGECKLGRVSDTGDLVISLNDIKTGKSVGTLNKNGKKHNNGECLLFPSKNMRDWSKFETPYKEGTYVVASNRLCIVKAKDENNYIDSYVAISSPKDKEPNKLFVRDDLQQLIKCNSIRLASKEEIDQINKTLVDNGYEWDSKNKRVNKLRWKPNDGETYFYIEITSSFNIIVKNNIWYETEFDLQEYNSGNCFKTKDEATVWCGRFNNAISKQIKEMENRK
jgi:hypothetical protein